jgi:hypothetical protein
MWGSRDRGGRTEVTCIACGADLQRSDAREYDKHGDRYDRRDKEFEYLCKPCYRDLCHQPREGLEDDLVVSGAGEQSRDAFLAAYAVEVGGEEPSDEPDSRPERGKQGEGDEHSDR